MLNRNIEERTCVSRQYILESLFTILYIGVVIFMYSMKNMILLITILFFLVSIFYIIYKNKKFSNLHKWKKVNATLLNAKVIKCLCFSAYNAYKQQAMRQAMYKPKILYKYIYNGEERTSDQYAISYDDVDCNFSHTKIEAQKIVKNSKNSKIIEIFVHEDTGESVITLNKARGYGIPYFSLAIAYLMILFLVYKIYYYV